MYNLEAEHHTAGKVNNRADSKLALFRRQKSDHFSELIRLAVSAHRQPFKALVLVLVFNGGLGVADGAGHNAVADNALVGEINGQLLCKTHLARFVCNVAGVAFCSSCKGSV